VRKVDGQKGTRQFRKGLGMNIYAPDFIRWKSTGDAGGRGKTGADTGHGPRDGGLNANFVVMRGGGVKRKKRTTAARKSPAFQVIKGARQALGEKGVEGCNWGLGEDEQNIL